MLGALMLCRRALLATGLAVSHRHRADMSELAVRVLASARAALVQTSSPFTFLHHDFSKSWAAGRTDVLARALGALAEAEHRVHHQTEGGAEEAASGHAVEVACWRAIFTKESVDGSWTVRNLRSLTLPCRQGRWMLG